LETPPKNVDNLRVYKNQKKPEKLTENLKYLEILKVFEALEPGMSP